MGKSQLGGVPEGLFSVGYHVATDVSVNRPPNHPTQMQKAIQAINLACEEYFCIKHLSFVRIKPQTDYFEKHSNKEKG